jgi:hypothetical protein
MHEDDGMCPDMGSVLLPTLFFLKLALEMWGHLWFHINVRIVQFLFKNIFGI